MSIFRTFGQEVESLNLQDLPGYKDLTEEIRNKVNAVYEQAFKARQHMGMKLAQGAAIATAKAVMEELLGTSVQDPTHTRNKFHKTLMDHGFKYTGSNHMFGGKSKSHYYTHPTLGTVGTVHGEGKPEAFHAKPGEQNSTSHFEPGTLNHVLNYHQALNRVKDYQEKAEKRKIQEGVAFYVGTKRFPNRTSAYAHAEKHGGVVTNTPRPTTSTPVKMKEDDSGSMQKQNVITKDAQEEPANPTKVGSWGKSPEFPPGEKGGQLTPDTGAEAIQKLNYKAKGFGPPEVTNESSWGEPKEHEPGATYENEMTEAEYQIFEADVTDAIRTAKHNGYDLQGQPQVSHLGTSFNLKHPSGHSLRLHISPDRGFGWSHTHSNGSRKSGSDPHMMTSHLHSLDEKHIGFAKLKGELEAKGKSANYAGAIAHKIGVEKYGAKAMKHAAKTHTPLG